MYKSFFKRFLDVFVSLIAFPFFILLVIFIAPFIFLNDKGKIFYISPRLGKNGKIFNMYKFRSMKTNARDLRNQDGSTFNSSKDVRLTKIGGFLRKSSIDEIPQLINVIKGDMSLIGPRPDLPEHILLYVGCEARKLEIRPGITGFNQAYHRNKVVWKQRIVNDIFYIDNMSSIFDFKIIIKTFIIILKKESVYIEIKGNDSCE